MRTARMLAGAALTITALGLAGAPALAGDYGKLEISPGTSSPGATVTVNTMACGPGGHGTGDASAVGGPAAFELKAGTGQEAVAGEFKVPDSAKPGTYGIGMRCDNGKEATGDLVVAGGDWSKPSPSMSMSPSMAPSMSMSPSMGMSMAPAKPPKGGMKTGVGGTSDGSGTAEIVAGATVLAVAAIGGTWYLRRRGNGGSRA
ncbi:hypothetical protein AB0K09_00790 [Streptomyces sp. NPDC049577]|uniref:hypothetical protein n=1 Tax=Streptomyces sp. NPDC049577 TaxID=3155153 RepID=UPI00341389C4